MTVKHHHKSQTAQQLLRCISGPHPHLLLDASPARLITIVHLVFSNKYYPGLHPTFFCYHISVQLLHTFLGQVLVLKYVQVQAQQACKHNIGPFPPYTKSQQAHIVHTVVFPCCPWPPHLPCFFQGTVHHWPFTIYTQQAFGTTSFFFSFLLSDKHIFEPLYPL